MAIEFRCTNCDKLLRTQAGSEGKKAKCPQCGTVLTIPDSTAPGAPPAFDAPPPREPDFSGAAPPPMASADSANPYQSPGAYGATTAPVTAGELRLTRIELGETLGKTWEIYKANLGSCIGGALVFFGCNLGVSFIVGIILGLALTPFAGNNPNEGLMIVAQIFQQLIGQAISAFFFVGLILFLLRVARGGTADYGLLFGGGPFFVQAAILQILLTIVMGLGFLLLIIPGVIIFLLTCQAMFVLVDRRAGIGDSLRLSMELMKGNKLTVLAIWIVMLGLLLLVTLVTCGIGLLLAWPFAALLAVVIYLGVSGQPTMVDSVVSHAAPERGFGAADLAAD